ncbi:MAG: hypothetical protein DDT26_00826 [Dehalococcoidia bacterium]|nr:hypothetical protein [Chloroflexota bacterium]
MCVLVVYCVLPMDMRELRTRSGKRAEEIAAEAHVSISTVRNWEQGRTAPRMTPLELVQLMKVYNCTFDELVAAELESVNHDSR